MAFDSRVTNCNHFKKDFKKLPKNWNISFIVLICTLGILYYISEIKSLFGSFAKTSLPIYHMEILYWKEYSIVGINTDDRMTHLYTIIFVFGELCCVLSCICRCTYSSTKMLNQHKWPSPYVPGIYFFWQLYVAHNYKLCLMLEKTNLIIWSWRLKDLFYY